MHNDARFVQRVLDGMFRAKDLTDLFECATPCFHEEEVDEDKFENVPEDE
jgi:hypothetical protein